MNLSLSEIFDDLKSIFIANKDVSTSSVDINASGIVCLFREVVLEHELMNDKNEFHEAVSSILHKKNEEDERVLTFHYLSTADKRHLLFKIYNKFYKGNFSDKVVAEFVDRQIIFNGGRIVGEHTDSETLINVAKDFYTITGSKIILDPCIGFGHLTTSLAKQGQIIKGIDITSQAIDVCRIRFMLRGLDTSFLKAGNAFTHSYEKKYESIVCTPPIGLRLLTKNKYTAEKNSQLAFLSLILDLLDKNGKAVIGLPNSSLDLRKNEIVRNLVKNNRLEAVISLPRNTLLHTAIPYNLIIIDKSRSSKNSIYFASLKKSDFSRTGEFEAITDYGNILRNYEQGEGNTELSVWVNGETVLSANTVLPLFFTKGLYRKLSDLFSQTPNEYLSLNDLIIEVKKGKSFRNTPKQKDTTQYPRNKITVNTLRQQQENIYLNTQHSAIEYNPQPEKSIDFVSAPDIVLFNLIGDSKYAITFKPNQQEHEFVTQDYISIIKVDEAKILAAYLCIQLKSDYVESQFLALNSGSVLSKISLKDLKSIKIYCPPIKEQKRTIAEYEELTLGYLDTLQEVLESETDSLKTLRHSVKQRISSADNILTVLKIFLDRKNKAGTALTDAESISKSPKFADLTPWVAIDMLKNELSGIAEIFEGVQILLNLETKTPTFLKEKIKKFTNERMTPFRHEFPNLEIIVSGKEIEVDFDKTLLAEVFSNLVRNAAKHSFPEKSEGKLEFEFRKIEDNVEIIFKNNGLPFPLGFSFVDYLKKDERAGKYGNTGLGGFIVGKVIKEIHKGDIYPLTSVHESPMAFQIILPVNQ